MPLRRGKKTICLIILALCILLARAADSPTSTSTSAPQPSPSVICRPFGRCEPCPDDALHQPFCQPFGNRRLMHCAPPPSNATAAGKATAIIGETPAWESCGRIPEVERADFYEFLASNVALAALGTAVVLARSRRLEMMQARQLAARIGLGRIRNG